MTSRDSLGLKLIIAAVPLIAGSYLLLEYVGDSLPVVILVVVGMAVLSAYILKFVFFSGKGKK